MNLTLDSTISSQSNTFNVSAHFFATFNETFPVKFEIDEVYDEEANANIYPFSNILSVHETTGIVTVSDVETVRSLHIFIKVSNCHLSAPCTSNTQILYLEVTGPAYVPEFAPIFMVQSLEDYEFYVRSTEDQFLVQYPEILDENVDTVQIEVISELLEMGVAQVSGENDNELQILI